MPAGCTLEALDARLGFTPEASLFIDWAISPTSSDSTVVATILFADIVGFTELAMRVPPADLVEQLNGIFSAFDELVDRLDLRIGINTGPVVAGFYRTGMTSPNEGRFP
jgi:class 3 adenylate cyclase